MDAYNRGGGKVTHQQKKDYRSCPRQEAIQEVYGRHIGYVLSLLNGLAEEGDFSGWSNEKRSPTVEQQIQNRAKQHLNEKQAKQIYR
jgi:hypothetical protein